MPFKTIVLLEFYLVKAVDAFMSVCTIFVFMALMEYCLVNIVLGDTALPKAQKNKQPQATAVPPVTAQPNQEFTYAASKFRASTKVRSSKSLRVNK